MTEEVEEKRTSFVAVTLCVCFPRFSLDHSDVEKIFEIENDPF